MLFDLILKLLHMAIKRVAIDLGTANSLVIVQGRGIVVSEPTVVAYSAVDNKVLSIGHEAKDMIGKSPDNIIVKRPLKKGVIASFKLTKALLQILLTKALGKIWFWGPEVMISVPAGLTSVEERAVIDAGKSAGASKIYLIPEPIAAAIGAKMPIGTSSGNMIVNMGGGTAEIAVISLNGLVKYQSKRVSGDAINNEIMTYMRRKFGMLVGEQMAEKVKIDIGSAIEMEEPIYMDVRGSDVQSGMPKSVKLCSNDFVEPIKSVLTEIIVAVKSVLEVTPPELASDIIDRGIVLSGGTALIRNIEILFTQALGVPAHVVDNPLTVVVEGVSEALNHLDILKRSLKY